MRRTWSPVRSFRALLALAGAPSRWRSVVCARARALVLVAGAALAGLFLLGLYCIPANSILPIPHEPGVFYFAKFYDPLWVAHRRRRSAAWSRASPTTRMVEAALRHPRIERAGETRVFRWAIRWMPARRSRSSSRSR